MFDLPAFIQLIGIVGVGAVIFAESGLLIGFFLPGDSLLFTAGLLAAHGYFDITLLILTCVIAAILGDSVGYMMGKHIGPRLFTRPKSLLFNPVHIGRTSAFFAKHGPRAIVLARFIPIVRTFTPVFAGVGQMSYRTFLVYNILGGVIWAAGIPFLGYFLGTRVPHIDAYLLPIVVIIVLVSLIPPLISYIRSRNTSSVELDK